MDSITVTDLVKRYGEHEAVKGITFSVPKGEVFGFLGPNGAGKPTTINVRCTLIKPTAGAATVTGYAVHTQRSEVRRSIGLVFQEATLDEYLPAEQNLLFHAYAYGVPRALRAERMHELLTLVALWDQRKQKIRTYSGGCGGGWNSRGGYGTIPTCCSSTSQHWASTPQHAAAAGTTSSTSASGNS